MKLPIKETSHACVDVVLVSAGPLSAMAGLLLARHFDLPPAVAETLLAKGRGPVATQMAQNRARAAVAILASFGVRLAIVPVGETALPDLFDLCLHLTDRRAAAFVDQKLRDLGLWICADRPDFFGPGGVQITNLDKALAEQAVSAFGCAAGVDVMVCAQNDALYDLFLASGQSRTDFAPQMKYLAAMGCRAPHPWPAVAVGLDRHMLAHFESRFANHGLVCVNQAFQRYDLVITGLGDLSIRDFADFLTLRGHNPSVAFDKRTQEQGLTIEYALNRKAAEQFVADYAMIGLQVRAEFVLRTEKIIKMPDVKPGFIKAA